MPWVVEGHPVGDPRAPVVPDDGETFVSELTGRVSPLPERRRQVPRRWLLWRHRSVTAFAFGAMIGSGWPIFLGHATAYALLAMIALGPGLGAAAWLGAAYGLGRGAALVVTWLHDRHGRARPRWEIQEHERFTVLCPARLPRATTAITPGQPPAPLVAHGGDEVVDFGYSGAAGPEGKVPVRLNAPERFLHFVVGRAFLGVPPGARPARLGGRRGLLAPATATGSLGSAPYFDNHVRFLWRERGTRYVATLHTFGERATERLLDRLVRELRPVRTLRVETPSTSYVRIFTRPADVAVGSGAVWVGATQNLAARGPRLLRVDPANLRARAVANAGQVDVHLALDRGGLWATGAGIGRGGEALSPLELRRLDPTSGRIVLRRRLAHLPAGGLAQGPDAVWVSANRFRRRGAAPTAVGTVWRIDRTTGMPTARAQVPGGAGTVAYGEGALWATGVGAPVISRLDPRTAVVTGTTRVGPRPAGLAIADGAVWVTDSRDGTVRRVDPETLRVTRTIAIGAAPYGIAAASGALWVAVLGDGLVARLDPSTGRITQRIQTGGDPIAVAADDDHVWVALNSDGELLRLPA